jgi:hypothetical protein
MMYRRLVLAGLLLPAAIALAQPPAGKKPEAGKPAAPATHGSPSTGQAPGKGDAMADAITAQEQKVWSAIGAQDYTAFAGFLADDFVEITPAGPSDKAGCIAFVKSGKLSKPVFSGWKVTKLGEGSAVVMYKVEFDWAGADGKVEHNSQYCASTWSKQGSGWVAHTHQETEAKAAGK